MLSQYGYDHPRVARINLFDGATRFVGRSCLRMLPLDALVVVGRHRVNQILGEHWPPTLARRNRLDGCCRIVYFELRIELSRIAHAYLFDEATRFGGAVVIAGAAARCVGGCWVDGPQRWSTR